MPETNNHPRPRAAGAANLNRLAYFVAVVETGSFTAAADRLGITKAVVSQQVARLEQEFRTTLLIRSTRRVRTTKAGQAFYYRCALILKEAEDAFGELTDSAEAPTGLLRLTAPFDYGIAILVPAITAFSARYPQCTVEANFSDQVRDVAADAIDLAIRVGWLTQQHVQARKIGNFEQKLVAAPGWQSTLNKLTGPADLADLPIIANLALREPTQWTFSRDVVTRQTVSMKAVLRFDVTLAVHEATRAGAGLSVLPDYVVAADIAAGRLIEVLPQWQLPRGDIHAVFPAARYRSAKVRAFVDLLVNRLAKLDGEPADG